MVGKVEKGVDASEVLRDSRMFPEVSEVLEPQSDTHPALEVLEASEELEALSDSRPVPEDVVLEAVIRRDLVEYRRDSRESRMAGTVLALEVLAEVKACVCGNKRNPA